MKLLTLFTLLLTTTLYSNSAMEQLYLKNACNSCHGMYGEGMGTAPRLQGVRKEKLLKRLLNLQKGKTRSAFGSIMISFAQSLDENQTIAMAQYLSELKTPQNVERYELEFDTAGDGGS